jgi:hypothetical protein
MATLYGVAIFLLWNKKGLRRDGEVLSIYISSHSSTIGENVIGNKTPNDSTFVIKDSAVVARQK